MTDNDVNNHEHEIALRNKSKRYEHERTRKLNTENNPQKQLFDEGDADSGIIYTMYNHFFS